MPAVKEAPARPDLQAHKESITFTFPEIVRFLAQVIGRKLTAYVGGVKDARAVERWLDGVRPYGTAETRLRLTFQIVRMLREYDAPEVIQSWLMGVNPELDDRVPIRLLREGEIEIVAPEVFAAARAFVAGG